MARKGGGGGLGEGDSVIVASRNTNQTTAGEISRQMIHTSVRKVLLIDQ